MFELQEMVVYLWLVPVAVQIVIPLTLLGCWLAASVPGRVFRKSTSAEVQHAAA